MPENIAEQFTRGDRDMIITLNVKMDNLKEAVVKLSDNTVGRLDSHDSRLDSLENSRSWVFGLLCVSAVVASLITYIYFSDIDHIKTDLEKHVIDTKN